MATAEETRERSASASERWYALDPEESAGRLGVVLGSGLCVGSARVRGKADNARIGGKRHG